MKPIHPRTLLARARASTLVRESTATFALRLAGAAFGFLSSLLFARYLGVAGYGELSVILAATALLATTASLGLPSLAVRLIATYHTGGDWPRLRGFIQFAHRWTLAAALVLTAGFVAWALVPGRGSAWTAYLVAAPMILLAALNQQRASILRGLNHVVAANLPEHVLRPSVVLVMLLTLPLVTGIDVQTAVAIQLAAVATSLVIGAGMLARRVPAELRHSPVVSEGRRWYREMQPFFLITLLQAVNLHFTLIYVASLSSVAEAGMFNVALRVVELVTFGLTAINLTIQPKLAAALSVNDRGRAQHLARQSARLASVAALAAAVALLLAGPRVLGLFGPDFGAAYPTLVVLLLGQLVVALTGPCGAVAAMAGEQRTNLVALAAATVLSIALGYALIPSLGAQGGAWARTAAVAGANLFMAWSVWRKVGLYTLPIGPYRRPGGR